MNMYRFRDGNYKPILETCTLIKETEKTWLVELYSAKHRILKSSKKKFAYSTVEEALYAYKRRKQKQMRILREQISECKERLDACETRLIGYKP